MLNNVKLKTKLTLMFLLLSIIPFILVSTLSIQIFSSELQEHTQSKLISIRNFKRTQLLDYFENLKQQTFNFTNSKLVLDSTATFYTSFLRLGDDLEESRIKAQIRYFPGSENVLQEKPDSEKYGMPYDVEHANNHPGYAKFVAKSDFTDIFVISLDGDIIYSVKKNRQFGTNLINGQFARTHLAAAFSKISKFQQNNNITRETLVFQDFQLDLASNSVVGYIACPAMKFNFVSGFVIYQLSTDKINLIMAEREGLGKTGETYLVGTDHLLRSTLFLNPENNTLEESFRNPTEHIISTDSIIKALDMNKGYHITTSYMNNSVLSAYTPVPVFNSTWALIAEITEKEANSSLFNLRMIVILVALASIVILIAIGRYLSISISKPITNLTKVSEVISTGNLEQAIEFTDRKDELGRLAKSFAHMRDSIREKIDLIQEQNIELESKIQVIKKQNDDLQLADKLKNEFLANTSHELRTPVNGLIGIAESMVDGATGELTPRQQANLKMMISSGRRLSNLVNDLLDFYKMRHKSLQLFPESVDLKTVVNMVLELSNHLVGDKPLRLINLIPDDLPPVLADHERLEQILYNLIGNAIKYTPDGRVTVNCLLKGEFIEMEVADTGIGISEEQQKKIFEPLVQGDGTISREYTGTGLGLSITRQLVEMHGGTISVESRTDLGSKFKFSLPVSKESVKSIAKVIKPGQAANQFYPVLKNPEEIRKDATIPNTGLIFKGQKTIMIVDDEIINLQVLENFLSLKNYRIIAAQDGFQALDMLEEEQPDLVLLDIMMPRLSGYEVCRRIRKEQDLIELPIIMITAKNRLNDLVEGFKAGANDYIVKPFYKEELYSRIASLLDAKESLERLRENKKLKEEIELRKQTQNALLASQRRLIRIIDNAEDGIMCLDESCQITFFNQGVCEISGFRSDELLDQSVYLIFPDFTPGHYFPAKTDKSTEIEIIRRKVKDLEMRKKDGTIKRIKTFISLIDMDDESLYSIIIRREQDESIENMIGAISDISDPVPENNVPENSEKIKLLREIRKNETRIKTLESALDGLTRHLGGDRPELVNQVRDLDPELDGIAGEYDKNEDEYFRKMLVDVMIKALMCWESSTGESKMELAEKSRIWRVYLDRGTCQTRTLNKYLYFHTLPKNPRWRDVLRTGQFVLSSCPDGKPHRKELEEIYNKLDKYLKTKH